LDPEEECDDGNNVDGDGCSAICDIEEPCIELLKEVSVDGGLEFHDANVCADAPNTEMAATYRLTVKNCGPVDLTNVQIWDPILGVEKDDAVNIGDLSAMSSQVFTAADLGFKFLDQPERCPDGASEDTQNPENKLNTAFVEGTAFAGTTEEVVLTDIDPACVKCEEECKFLRKLVSVDGGITFFDANTEDTAVIAGFYGAIYRICATNCGERPLKKWKIVDKDLPFYYRNSYLDRDTWLDPGEEKCFTVEKPDVCEDFVCDGDSDSDSGNCGYTDRCGDCDCDSSSDCDSDCDSDSCNGDEEVCKENVAKLFKYKFKIKRWRFVDKDPAWVCCDCDFDGDTDSDNDTDSWY
jgi:cysteine-rich repeat protein